MVNTLDLPLIVVEVCQPAMQPMDGICRGRGPSGFYCMLIDSTLYFGTKRELGMYVWGGGDKERITYVCVCGGMYIVYQTCS